MDHPFVARRPESRTLNPLGRDASFLLPVLRRPYAKADGAARGLGNERFVAPSSPPPQSRTGRNLRTEQARHAERD